MRNTQNQLTALSAICAVALIWPIVPLLGVLFRGTLDCLLLDMAIGAIMSGTVLLLAGIHTGLSRDATSGDSAARRSISTRLGGAGLMLIIFGVFGLISELW